MEAEQAYHADRLHMINRFTTGPGIVHGLTVQTVTETDAGLEMTVDAGLALDGKGRPIVVEQLTTKSLPTPSTDEIHLFIQYKEAPMESVPVPDTDGAIENDVAPNRLVEVFEFTYRETPPDDTGNIPPLDSLDVNPEAVGPQVLAQYIAETYHDQHRSGDSPDTPTAVFLGSFERAPDGSWEPMTDGPTRPFVYDHDLLFATIVNHLTDTDNPHQTPIKKERNEIPDDLDRIGQRVNALENELQTIEREHATVRQYLLRKTVKDRIRFFEDLSNRLERQSGNGSKLARTITEQSREELQVTETGTHSYRQQLNRLLEQLIQLGEPLETVATEKSLERYLKSVSRLQSAIEDNKPLLELVDAHDQVCEAADSLEILVGVVPDE